MKHLHTSQNDTAWYQVASGIKFKSTPGHGWIVLDTYKLNQMKSRHPELVLSPPLHGKMSCYEEDCEINLVILAFWQDLHSEFNLNIAVRSVVSWYPVMFCRWVLKCIETGEIDEILQVLDKDLEIEFRESDMVFQTHWKFADYVSAVRDFLPEIKESV
jgi:hypothetical protein